MAVNSFIAALGNILEGASSDRERTRKLKELEEDRVHVKLLQRQDAEDRAERRAREKQAEADRLEALGYESETVLKSRLAGLGDAPAYEPGAASFDLGMDGVASKPAVGSLKPSPFSGARLGVIGQDPFSGAKAQGMVEGADKAEQRKETQRRLASLVDVAGQGRMYATTRAQQLAAEEQREALRAERALDVARDNARVTSQLVEKDNERKLEVKREAWDRAGIPKDLQARLEGGEDIGNLYTSKYQQESLQIEKDKLQVERDKIAAGQRKGGMTAAQKKGFASNKVRIEELQDLQTRLQASVNNKENITGPFKGRMPGYSTLGTVLGVRPFSQKSQILARDVNLVGNKVLHDFSGAAIPMSELPRHYGAIPSKYADEELNIATIARMIATLERTNDLMLTDPTLDPSLVPIGPAGGSTRLSLDKLYGSTNAR